MLQVAKFLLPFINNEMDELRVVLYMQIFVLLIVFGSIIVTSVILYRRVKTKRKANGKETD